LLLNIRGWRRWAGDRDIWRQTIEEARVRCGLSRHWRRRYIEATEYRHQIFWLQSHKRIHCHTAKPESNQQGFN